MTKTSRGSYFSRWIPDIRLRQGEITASAVLYGVIIVLPFLWLIISSFTANNAISFSILNERTIGLLKNSLTFAAVSATLATFLGAISAIGLIHFQSQGHFVLSWLPFVLFIPPYLHILGWISFLDFLSRMFPNLGLSKIFYYHGAVLAVLIMVFTYTPLATSFILARMKNIGRHLLEAGMLVFTPMEVFRKIIFPILRNTLIGVWLIVFSLSIVEYSVPLQANFPVLSTELISSFFEGGSVLKAFSLSLYFLLPMTIVGLWLTAYFKGEEIIEIGNNDLMKAPVFDTAFWSPAISFPCGLLTAFLILGLAIPILGMIVGTVTRSVNSATLFAGFPSVVRSLVLAFLSASAATVIAYAFGDYLSKRKPVAGLIGLFFPLAVPPAMTGIACIALFSSSWLAWARNSEMTVFFSHLARILPFCVLYFFWSRLVSRKSPAFDAATLETCHWTLLLGLDRRLFISAFSLGFLLSFRELDVTILTVPPGSETLPIRLFNLMHYGASGEVCSLGLLLFILLGIGGSRLFHQPGDCKTPEKQRFS